MCVIMYTLCINRHVHRCRVCCTRMQPRLIWHCPPPPAFSKEEEEGWGRGSHRKVSASSAPCWSHVCRREDIDCAFVEFLYRGISVEKEPRDFRFRPL